MKAPKAGGWVSNLWIISEPIALTHVSDIRHYVKSCGVPYASRIMLGRALCHVRDLELRNQSE